MATKEGSYSVNDLHDGKVNVVFPEPVELKVRRQEQTDRETEIQFVSCSIFPDRGDLHGSCGAYGR